MRIALAASIWALSNSLEIVENKDLVRIIVISISAEDQSFMPFVESMKPSYGPTKRKLHLIMSN
jgi:hypothetical protein